MRLWLIPFRDSPDKWVLVAAERREQVFFHVDGIYGEPGREEDWIELRSPTSIDLTAEELELAAGGTTIIFRHAEDDFGFHHEEDRAVIDEVAKKRLSEFDPDEPRTRYVWLSEHEDGSRALYMFGDEDPFRKGAEVIATVVQRRPFHNGAILDAVRSTVPGIDRAEIRGGAMSERKEAWEGIDDEDLGSLWI